MAHDLKPTPGGDFGSLAIHDLLPERPALIGEFSPAYEAFREATIADLARSLSMGTSRRCSWRT